MQQKVINIMTKFMEVIIMTRTEVEVRNLIEEQEKVVRMAKTLLNSPSPVASSGARQTIDQAENNIKMLRRELEQIKSQ